MQVFLSHAGEDAFEASLLQFAVETVLTDLGVRVWTYQRDQTRDQKAIAENIKEQVRRSRAMLFLVSPASLRWGKTQWMEFAYADAAEIPTFVLLSHLTFAALTKHEKGVPPLLLQMQCNAATAWRDVVADLRARLTYSVTTEEKS